MAVAQVGRQGVEDEHYVSHAEQRVAADLPATGVPEETGEGAEEDDVEQPFDDFLQEVHATGGDRHHH